MVKYCGNCGRQEEHGEACMRCLENPFSEWVTQQLCIRCGNFNQEPKSAACRNCVKTDEGYSGWVPANVTDINVGNKQEAKADAGKLELDLVPMQIVKDIAEVRMYGNAKYGDPENWKTVEMRRYVNALLRHLLAFLDDHNSVDEESGIPHYKHMECNMAFISHMMQEGAGDGR